MKRCARLRALAFLASFWAPHAHGGTVAADCEVPGEFTEAAGALPHVEEALARGQLDILAVGSATMQGPVKSPPGFSFPFRLAQALRDARPGLNVMLDVESERGMTASEQLERMRVAVGRHPFHLVLWQTGTVEAVKNLSAAEFGDILADGASLAGAAHADLVLVDPQFSRFLRANTNLEPYQSALQKAATLPDVLLFRRYDLTRAWVNDGTIDLERAKIQDRTATAQRLHGCLGEAMGRVVLEGAAHIN